MPLCILLLTMLRENDVSKGVLLNLVPIALLPLIEFENFITEVVFGERRNVTENVHMGENDVYFQTIRAPGSPERASYPAALLS